MRASGNCPRAMISSYHLCRHHDFVMWEVVMTLLHFCCLYDCGGSEQVSYMTRFFLDSLAQQYSSEMFERICDVAQEVWL